MAYSSLSKLSRKALIRKYDEAFSQYIRVKDAVDGEATCVTCGVTASWKDLQNGHFYTRGRFPTRWDEMNCHVQCYRCNIALKGNYIVYTKYMIDRYGREAVDELEVKSLSTQKLTSQEMRDLIVYYRQMVKKLTQSGYPLDPVKPETLIPWGT